MKYCQKCRAELKDDAKFCYHCGQKQDEQEPQNNYNRNPYVYVPNQDVVVNPYAGNTLGIVSMGLGLAVPIAGIICGVYAISKGKIAKNKQAIITGIIGIVLSAYAWITNIMNLL